MESCPVANEQDILTFDIFCHRSNCKKTSDYRILSNRGHDRWLLYKTTARTTIQSILTANHEFGGGSTNIQGSACWTTGVCWETWINYPRLNNFAERCFWKKELQEDDDADDDEHEDGSMDLRWCLRMTMNGEYNSCLYLSKTEEDSWTKEREKSRK